MIFASFIFLFAFLPLFLAGYYALPGRGRNLFLTVASYVFYGWWRPDFVLLMLISTVVDYQAARRMSAPDARRRVWLVASLCTNLGLLAYLKYANLVVDTVDSFIDGSLDWEKVVLPVGISFYTFQSMSYTIDVYRGQARPVRSFLDLACYVSMFPQLVAGPIVRYRDIQDELASRTHTFAKFSAGVFLFQIGFVKKILLADNAALVADLVFAAPDPGFVDAWTGVLGYALQIYFDFSGYSDMALGLGLMIGFHFPKNFDSPYMSRSITEFWRRWHISLSTWLRDYLYIPLGGNRYGYGRMYVNLAATMLLGGLWHGAAWTFVLWGAYQGFFLVIERLAGKRSLYGGVPRALQTAITFIIVLGGWAIFRADGTDGLAAIFGGMSGFHGFGEYPLPGAHPVESQLGLAVGLGVALFGVQSTTIVRQFRPGWYWFVCALFLVALGQLAARDFTPFIYFQF